MSLMIDCDLPTATILEAREIKKVKNVYVYRHSSVMIQRIFYDVKWLLFKKEGNELLRHPGRDKVRYDMLIVIQFPSIPKGEQRLLKEVLKRVLHTKES